MQEKESVMVVRCELKIPSLGITVRHLKPIKDSYFLRPALFFHYLLKSSFR